MATKKYPIGTPIIFVSNESMCSQAQQDNGKEGKIIGETPTGRAKIFLPNSVKKSWCVEYTWDTDWDNIKLLRVKNQQLLFDFMN